MLILQPSNGNHIFISIKSLAVKSDSSRFFSNNDSSRKMDTTTQVVVGKGKATTVAHSRYWANAEQFIKFKLSLRNINYFTWGQI